MCVTWALPNARVAHNALLETTGKQSAQLRPFDKGLYIGKKIYLPI